MAPVSSIFFSKGWPRFILAKTLVEELEQVTPEQRDDMLFRAFLAELWERDRDLAQYILDSALDQSALVIFLPALQSAVELDEYGVRRLKQALIAGQVPAWRYRDLAIGHTTALLSGAVLKDLLLLLADQDDGFDVAVTILFRRLSSDSSVGRKYEPELLEAGQEILQRITSRRSNQRSNYEVAGIVQACLIGPNASSIATGVAVWLRQSVVISTPSLSDNSSLLITLLELQPIAVMDALFVGDENDEWVGMALFKLSDDNRRNPADTISCETLIAWCERDGEYRYPLAASIITFAYRPKSNEPQVWSEQAKALLVQTPNLKAVLDVLIARFRPGSWSGSYAALIEENARLLDSLESYIPSSFIPFVTEAKAQLAQEIARERQQETERDRTRDERFEW